MSNNALDAADGPISSPGVQYACGLYPLSDGVDLLNKQLITVCGRELRVSGRIVRMCQLEADGYEFLGAPEPILEGLRQTATRVDLFTFTQKLVDIPPRYVYPMEWDNFAALRVTSFDSWWKEIRPEARNRARQAEKKGVVLREVPFSDSLVKGIWRIYNESPVRQGRRFPHYGKDVSTVYHEEATFLDSSVFIGAFLNEELIGFVKLTADEENTQANLMNILSLLKHRDKAPTNALIAHSVRACATRGISYLVYQSFSYGKKEWDGIMKFKEVNGFSRIDVPRYYVPLTPIGWCALRLGLHRRLVDRLPEPVTARLRAIRNLWHNRKLHFMRESA